MKLKKLLLSCSLALMLSASPAWAIDFVCEPEDNNAASYSVFFYCNNKMEVTFIKYAPETHQDEYWLRLSGIGVKDKLLNKITLTISGTPYELTASNPTFDISSVAVTTMRNYSPGLFGSGPSLRTNIRFFKLTPDMVEQLQTAKDVTLKYDTFKRINQSAPVREDSLVLINKAFTLEYEQYPEYWKPNDDAK